MHTSCVQFAGVHDMEKTSVAFPLPTHGRWMYQCQRTMQREGISVCVYELLVLLCLERVQLLVQTQVPRFDVAS